MMIIFQERVFVLKGSKMKGKYDRKTKVRKRLIKLKNLKKLKYMNMKGHKENIRKEKIKIL